jgi:hypothetical protein
MNHPALHHCHLPAWRRCLAALAACSALTAPALAADEPDAGDRPTPARKAAAAGAGLRWGAESLRVEGMRLTDHPTARSTIALRANWFAAMKATPALEWRLGLRTDADQQNNLTGHRQAGDVAWGDTWLRWRDGDARITAGMQTVLWGRVDAVSLIDRVSRVDLRRFALDELKERRLPLPALRWEHEWGSYKSDLVLLAGFQNTQLPENSSIWHPIDRAGAQIIGTPAAPALSGFFMKAPLQQINHRSGGAALRVTHAGDGFDHGFTIGRTRQTLPFFQLDLVGNRILASQPFVRHVAADAELVTDAATWRAEIAHSRDLPMTALDGARLKANSTEFAGGVEFFPGGRDTRVNLQLLMRAVDTDHTATVELRRYTSISGEVETSLKQGAWKAAFRFASALNIQDLYISPRLSYVGWEPHEFYIAGHYFRGEGRGFGGFFQDNNAVAVGLKTRF